PPGAPAARPPPRASPRPPRTGAALSSPCPSILSPLASHRGGAQLALPLDPLTARLAPRRRSARTATRSSHRSPRTEAALSSHCHSILSPLASHRGGAQLALPLDPLTARLAPRRRSARTATRSSHRSPRTEAALSSHCHSILSPLASHRGGAQLA